MRDTLRRSPLWESAALHLVGILFFYLLTLFLQKWLPPAPPPVPRPVTIKIKEAPTVTTATLPLDVRQQEPPVKTPSVQPRKVFGLRNNTLTSDSASAVGIKAGNTLATVVDREELKPGEEALPMPTDDFLVTQMPRLLNEMLIPYPAEARAQGVEGVVIMDLLIDTQGNVREALLLSGPGFGLNESALDAIKKFKFSPALVDQQPVAVRMRYGYRFVLD